MPEYRPLTRRDMVVFLRERLSFFQKRRTREQRATVVLEIFSYLLLHSDCFEDYFSGNRLVRVVYDKCEEMIEEQLLSNDFPNILHLAIRLRDRVKRLLPGEDREDREDRVERQEGEEVGEDKEVEGKVTSL